MSDLRDLVNPLIWREIASIGAIEAAVARQTDSGYSFLLTESKLEKQANVTQLTMVLRLAGEQPDFSTGVTGALFKAQSALTQAIDTTATLRTMRLAGRELLAQYTSALERVDGLPRTAVRRALMRAIVHDTVLSAHIARRTGDPADERDLPRSLSAYFATDKAQVCMRCLLDRPGRAWPLERSEPRPHQYICGACHHEVLEGLPSDLREQAERWPVDLREDRVIHRALSRPERLKAIHQILYPLSGIESHVPEPAAAHAIDVPEAIPTPGPRGDAPDGVVTIHPAHAGGLEDEYVTILFTPDRLRRHW
jgi:hypothetical protein